MEGNAIIISADEIKETLPGYRPERSSEFHRESTRLADKQYINALKDTSHESVILLSGGSASGKTEYLSAYVAECPAVIFDGTLPTLEGFEIKMREAHKYGKHVEVHAVIPDDLQRAYSAFLERDRKYEEHHFYKTHADSRRTLLHIANQYPDTVIQVIESSIETDGSMAFAVLHFSSHERCIDYLRNLQYSENMIRDIVTGYGEN